MNLANDYQLLKIHSNTGKSCCNFCLLMVDNSRLFKVDDGYSTSYACPHCIDELEQKGFKSVQYPVGSR